MTHLRPNNALHLAGLLWVATGVLALLLAGEAHAQVRYDLYRGSQKRWLPAGAVPIAPNYLNSDSDFNTNYTTYMNNLISFSNTAGSIAGSATSNQVYYPSNSFILCDIGHYNGSTTYNNSNNILNAKAACDAQYQGYVGYTAILLNTPGTYKFSTLGNDSVKIDQAILTSTQAKTSPLDYKALAYTATTGIMRLTANSTNDGTGTNWDGTGTNGTPTFSNTTYVSPNFYDSVRFFSITVAQPTYLMLRMYWNNWGSEADFAVGWQPPGASSYSLIPKSNTCDPQAPTKACFPDLAIQKTGPAYIKPSTSSSKTYISYSIAASVNNSATGITSTYGTTTITDTLPANLNWDSTSTVSAPSGWTCTVAPPAAAQPTITCTTTNILSSASTYSFTLNNLLVATGTAAGSSMGSATGTSAQALPGNTLHYCIVAQNQGGADLNNYTITDPIDTAHQKNITNISLLVDNVAVAGSTYSNATLTTPAFTLKAGKSAQLCFDTTVI